MDLVFIDRVSVAVAELAQRSPHLLTQARELPLIYKDRRGLMVVDVVASRQRKYESQVKKILDRYVENVPDLGLAYLAQNPPEWLMLKKREPETISAVAQNLVNFGSSEGIIGDEEICAAWALLPSGEQLNEAIDPRVQGILNIWGIGEVLLQYLRMLSGADTLKVDVRVIDRLKTLGVPVELFSNKGLLNICTAIAAKSGLSLSELDQILWSK